MAKKTSPKTDDSAELKKAAVSSTLKRSIIRKGKIVHAGAAVPSDLTDTEKKRLKSLGAV